MWKILLTFIFITCMISSANSAQITCQFSGNTCNVVSATAITQPNEVITLTGYPSNYVNTAIQMIKFNGINLAYFPTGIHNFFPNMAAVSMNGCYTTKLMKNSFSNCPNLVSIQITNGNILSVPEEFAQTCTKIIGIYLVQNNIVTVNRFAFKGLKNLVFLDLSYNKITCLSNDLFQTTPSLNSINFSNNKITKVDWRLFTNLPNLKTVDLKLNMITSLPYFDLTTTGTSPMVTGFTFYFDFNQINSINPDICHIFTLRAPHTMDNVYLSNNPCLANNVYNIDKYNCRLMANVLKNCYSKWSFPSPVPVLC